MLTFPHSDDSSRSTGHLDILRWLSQIPNFDANIRRPTTGGTADTPLHIAARAGHLELVAYLSDICGCDVSPRLGPSKAGFSPLHCAIEGGHKAVVKYLVDEAKADVEGRGEKAARKGSLEFAKAHTSATRVPETSSTVAAPFAGAEGAERRASKPAQRQSQLVTPLICATISGQLSIANRLLGLGRAPKRPSFGATKPSGTYDRDAQPYANPDGTESRSGQTALHYACQMGRIDLVKLLIKGKANPEILCAEKQVSPLFCAVECGHIAIVRFLIEVVEVDASFDGYVERDLPPIRIALQNGHGLVARYLEQYGAAHKDRDRRFSQNTRVFLRTIDDESAEKLHAISGVSGVNVIEGLAPDENGVNAQSGGLTTAVNSANPNGHSQYFEPLMHEQTGVFDFENFDRHRIEMDAINCIQILDDSEEEIDPILEEESKKEARERDRRLVEEKKRKEDASKLKLEQYANEERLLAEEKTEADAWRRTQDEARVDVDGNTVSEQNELVDTDQLGVVKSILEATEADEAKAAARAGSAKGRRDKRCLETSMVEVSTVALSVAELKEARARPESTVAEPKDAKARPEPISATASKQSEQQTDRAHSIPSDTAAESAGFHADGLGLVASRPQEGGQRIAELKAGIEAQNERDAASDRALAEQADKLATEAEERKRQLAVDIAKEKLEQKAAALAAEKAKLREMKTLAAASHQDAAIRAQQKEWREDDARESIVMHRLTHDILQQSNQPERPIRPIRLSIVE